MTMRISLDDIRSASECLRYLSFLKDTVQPPAKKETFIITKVMQKAYLQATETRHRADWRTIVNWVDGEVFKGVTIDHTEEFDGAKMLAEHILIFLRSWYENIHLRENCIGYTNLALEQTVQGVSIYSEVPILKLENVPIIMYIDNIAMTDSRMYNDIKARGLMWLVSEALDCDIVMAQHLAVGPRGGITVNNIEADRDAHGRALEMIANTALLVKNGFTYPSVTEKCEVCPFSRRCRL